MKKSHIILIIVAIYYLIFGIAEDIYKPIDIKFFHMILNTLFAFIWCKEHAIENNKSTGVFYRVLAALFPLIGISIYLFKFFGFKTGGTKMLQVILFFILCISLYLLPSYL